MSNLIPVDQIQTMALSVAKSGLFGIKTPDQAFALMLIAQAEGLHPAIAARDYHVINGRPTLKADAMLARFQTAGGKVEWKEYSEKTARAVISHPQGGSVEVEWTLAMAEKAGLTKNPTWKQYPRQMLRARVISEGIRTVFPGVAVGVYTPEEVEDFDPPKRKMKDVTPAPEPIPEEPTGKLPGVLLAIKEAKTADDLAAIKPTIMELNDHERSIAVEAGINRRNVITQPVTMDADGVIEGESNDE